jgi:hypothetical protein
MKEIIRYREGAAAQLPSPEGMQAQTSRLLRREEMALVLPSRCSAARSPLPIATARRRVEKEEEERKNKRYEIKHRTARADQADRPAGEEHQPHWRRPLWPQTLRNRRRCLHVECGWRDEWRRRESRGRPESPDGATGSGSIGPFTIREVPVWPIGSVIVGRANDPTG